LFGYVFSKEFLERNIKNKTIFYKLKLIFVKVNLQELSYRTNLKDESFYKLISALILTNREFISFFFS